VSDYRYDVFISYAREDLAWAEALERTLREQHNIRVFRDSTDLQPGARFAPQLVEAIKASRHMLVLWSQHAAGSPWVMKERFRFESDADPKGTGLDGDRRLFLLALGGPDPSQEDVHVITDVDAAGIYPDAGPAGAEWDATVRAIADRVRADQRSRPIPLLLVTTTRERAEGIAPDAHQPDGPPLRELLGKLDMADITTFRDSYGAGRADWRPFGCARDVRALLAELADDLNAEIAATGCEGVEPFHWEYVDEAFWGEVVDAERVARRMTRGPAVVVVDPLSFYDEVVYNRFLRFLPPVLLNGDALVLVLPPFTLHAPDVALRDAVRAAAPQFFNQFSRPPAFSGRPYARCRVPVNDDIELWGWVATAVAHPKAHESRENEYLAMVR
jgi:hypothetical protein